MQGAREARRLVAAAVGAATAALVLAPAGARAQTGVEAATTNHDLARKIPITPRPRQNRTVVQSLGPGELPALASGETLRTSAELHVSTTCVAPDPRCIGRRYSFNPTFSAQIVLADSPDATGGTGTLALTPRVTHACGQRRPNRNHHCVITLPETAVPISDASALPCPAGGCYLNLVTDAYNRHARKGNRLVIGNDQPDGTVHGGRGQLSAVVVPPGLSLGQSSGTTAPLTTTIPTGGRHSGFQTVVYSVELDGLRAGDVITASALQNTDVGAFSLPLFVGDQLILTGSPDRTDPAKAFGTAGGDLDPANGFNCTQGRSPYHNPCRSPKAGAITITRDAFTRNGDPKPLFLNLITRAYEKVAQAQAFPGPAVRVLPGGFLNVTRYPAPLG
jgi:hypothetical protein